MRNIRRSIYTSSYDRGLEHAVKMWPKVKEAVPDAEFHVFYGWQLFDKFYKGNPGSMAWKAKLVKGMEYEGIVDHGRVSQDQLVDEYKKSGLWVYPTHFGEINCISAIKAQAYGCEPVVINYAALKETVQYGRKVEGDIYDEETKDKFLSQWIEALTNPMSDEEREKMSKWAWDKYRWENIAKQWDKEFKEVDNE